MNKITKFALATAAFAAAISSAHAGPAPSGGLSTPSDVVKVQACGWYAIYSCTRNFRAAQRWSDNYGLGYVIRTGDYPNFRPGWFCVVDGPMNRNRANRAARQNRDIAPTSYAKSAC